MGKIIDRVRERAQEARRAKLLKSLVNQPMVLETPPVDRSRAARKERVAVCEALGLEPWADLDKAIIPAIEGLKAAASQDRYRLAIESHLGKKMGDIHLAMRVGKGKPDSELTRKNKAIASELMDILNEINPPTVVPRAANPVPH